jgi:hypothetical protein
MIPGTYAEWRHCIEHECKIELSPSFISERLATLRNESGEDRIRFTRRYGDGHLKQVIGWFERALREIAH